MAAGEVVDAAGCRIGHSAWSVDAGEVADAAGRRHGSSAWSVDCWQGRTGEDRH